jgi:hypothetical protein
VKECFIDDADLRYFGKGGAASRDIVNTRRTKRTTANKECKVNNRGYFNSGE